MIESNTADGPGPGVAGSWPPLVACTFFVIWRRCEMIGCCHWPYGVPQEEEVCLLLIYTQ